MDTGAEMQKVLRMSPGKIGVHLLWHIIHLALSIWFIIVSVAQMLENFLISTGYPKSYRTLNIHKVKYLAVVIDSEEAKQTEKVLRLVEWLKKIGVKKFCLYDTEGVLKKSKDTFKDVAKDSVSHQHIDVHLTSFHDGKEAVAKAANFLLKKYYSDPIQGKPNLTEHHMAEALDAIGHGGPDPDLLLIYGPARIHLGFPAWRLRYTEIVHMGSLNSMKFGLLTKAIHKFTMVHQNYGA